MRTLRVVLAGGKTAGPVVTLLAVAEAIKQNHPAALFVLADISGSVGERLAREKGLGFTAIRTGKLRRYFSWSNFLTPFLVFVGFLQALVLLRRFKPDLVIGAGGFVQVPVAWAAWALRIPVHIHQQDVTVTLANALCAPVARSISVTFESSLRDFRQGSGLFSHVPTQKPIVWTGNPVRPEILTATKVEAQSFFQLSADLPTLFVLGGGSGAQKINQLVMEALPQLGKVVQILHSTGLGKMIRAQDPNYHAFEFIERNDLAYAAADIVLARAGVATIADLSNLSKIAIIIPMADTHQEANAQLLYERRAAVVLDERELTPDALVEIIRKILFNLELQRELARNINQLMPHKSAQKIAEIVFSHVQSK
jgi:UDP-N-acetylglucosamine--N-acetylmuramyl-(pentapeptide) pyrophosphoryl-undecaprenol N-acetylglucosamine transferase